MSIDFELTGVITEALERCKSNCNVLYLLMKGSVLSQATSKGIYISTYGCQMNVNDSDRMYALMEMSNYHPVNTPDQASLIVINSCSVREKPVHKVHSEVGRYKNLKAKNPSLKIGVAGCVAQQEKKKLLSAIPLLDFVMGPDAIDKLPEIVRGLEEQPSDKVNSTRFTHGQPYQVETMVKNPGVSTFVNITKGCDNFCTFCVVPFTRGRERSRSLKELISDITLLTKRGVREVTLLGQNVNSYKSDCGTGFSELLVAVAEQTSIERIRYTTSHPKDFNQELVNVHKTHRRKVCDYIHLPVQSGNTEVLERMNRGYSREEYLEKVKMIREGVPGVALSTDIIVGFPGETREQFEETLSLLAEVRYDLIFAFKYSPRPFTKAARWEDHLSDAEKSSRLEEVFQLQKEISAKEASDQKGQIQEVLVEEISSEGTGLGRNSKNRKAEVLGVDTLGEKIQVGKKYWIEVESARNSLFRGHTVPEPHTLMSNNIQKRPVPFELGASL